MGARNSHGFEPGSGGDRARWIRVGRLNHMLHVGVLGYFGLEPLLDSEFETGRQVLHLVTAFKAGQTILHQISS